jgi:hypothetical protein
MPTKLVYFADLDPKFGIKFHRNHLKRLIADGDFPQPLHLGTNTRAWEEAEIEAYIARKRTEREARLTAAAAAPDTPPPTPRRRGRPPYSRSKQDERSCHYPVVANRCKRC